MLEMLKDDPWLIPASLAMLVPICGIIFGTITNHLTRVRRAELEAGLKQTMLQRGMSAEEIKTVIEATAQRRGKMCIPDSAIRQEVS
jgi:hypothetical protein